MNRIRSIQIDDELWPLLGKMAQANGISREMMVDRLIRPILIHEENKVKRNPIANLRKKSNINNDKEFAEDFAAKLLNGIFRKEIE